MESVTILKGSKACMWGIRLAVLGVALLLISYVGARIGLSPMAAMLGITFAVLSFAIGSICALVGLIRSGGNGGGRSLPLVWGSLIAGIAAIAATSMTLSSAGGPPIHDISTDMDNPPEFVAVAKLRTPDENPVEYSGADTAAQQRAAYPDIEPIFLAGTPDSVFEQSLNVVKAMGWEIVAEDASNYRIEATDTTPFVGFKDDVVIRLIANGNQTRVDVRSKSRVGMGDMGVNAKRVREFITRLKEAAGS